MSINAASRLINHLGKGLCTVTTKSFSTSQKFIEMYKTKVGDSCARFIKANRRLTDGINSKNEVQLRNQLVYTNTLDGTTMTEYIVYKNVTRRLLPNVESDLIFMSLHF